MRTITLSLLLIFCLHMCGCDILSAKDCYGLYSTVTGLPNAAKDCANRRQVYQDVQAAEQKFNTLNGAIQSYSGEAQNIKDLYKQAKRLNACKNFEKLAKEVKEGKIEKQLNGCLNTIGATDKPSEEVQKLRDQLESFKSKVDDVLTNTFSMSPIFSSSGDSIPGVDTSNVSEDSSSIPGTDSDSDYWNKLKQEADAAQEHEQVVQDQVVQDQVAQEQAGKLGAAETAETAEKPSWSEGFLHYA